MSGNLKRQKFSLEIQVSTVFFLWMQNLFIYKSKHETSVDIVGRENEERKTEKISNRFVCTS